MAAGLLHDTVEDTNVVTFEKIEEEFGTTVRHIVEGETKVLIKLGCKVQNKKLLIIFLDSWGVIFSCPKIFLNVCWYSFHFGLGCL